MKIKAEMNETEMKNTIERINETKSWFTEKIKLINPYSDSPRKKGENSNQQTKSKKKL